MSMLISKELVETIPDLYETEEIPDPICHIKLFTPDSNWTWYIIELSKKDYDVCFGYVIGMEHELGYFSLKEIEVLQGNFGLSVEVDCIFQPVSLTKIKKLHYSI